MPTRVSLFAALVALMCACGGATQSTCADGTSNCADGSNPGTQDGSNNGGTDDGQNGSSMPDGGGISDGGSDSCGGELFQATRVQANFLIVLDHSGSMMSSVGGAPKWSSAVSAVTGITQQYDGDIRFGLQLFSFASSKCSAGKIDVPVGDGNSSAISNALPSDADGSGTPIAGALEVARQSPGLADTTRSNNVLLITDGEENCNGDPVQQVEALFSAGVKTYVVGFGSSVDATMLSQMATAGGTALNGTRKYYQADDLASLQSALSQVAQGAIGCDFQLQDVPPDPSKIYVYVNGQLQTHDASKQNGWEYAESSNRLTLYGATCGVVANDANAKVSIVYGCPDGTLVEGGGNGGTSDPSDGGGIPIN